MSTTRRRRPALILLVTLAALGCLGLAWWQWSRFQSNSGTFQNLGYALQWPMFAAFCFYAYYKFVRYEEGDVAPPSTEPTEIPMGLLPERPAAATTDDPEMAEYNAYLAALAKTDKQDRTTR
jgi:DNA-binding transcriptional regulator of glucitol operon